MSLQSRPHAELSRIGIFFIVGIIIVAMSSDGFAQCDDTVSVYFGNGFGDVNNGALNDAAALYDHLIERLSASSVAPPCAVMLAHDSNAPFVRKVIQAATQGLATSDDIWKVLDGLIPATPAIQDAIRANIALFDPLAPTTVADLDTQVAAYRSDLLAGKQVVVVAHSQGNFFAIQALSVLNNDPGLAPLLGNFHVLSVASPASFAPRQYWITAFGDPIWQVVPLSLPWTTLDDSLCLPLVDWHCHLFPSYLDGKISGTGISDYVASFFKSSGPFGDIAVQVTLNGSPWESQPSDNISYVVQAHTSGPIVAIFGSSIPSVTVSAQGGG